MPTNKVISSLDELLPHVKEALLKVLKTCTEQGAYFKVIETYRTEERQNYLYSLGRSIKGKNISIVTYTRGTGAHGKRIAVDCVIDTSKHGLPAYDTTEQGKKLWFIYGRAAEDNGFLWGGRWRKGMVDNYPTTETVNLGWDCAHIQYIREDLAAKNS